MAISEAFAGSQLVDTTEWSCPRDAAYDSGQVQTDDGVYQVFIELSDMVTGDELQIRIYDKVGSAGGQLIILQANLIGPQSPAVWVSPALILMHGWDVTLDCIAGTSIDLDWSIRKVA